MTSTTQPIIALAIKHGASSYTNRADTQHPAYGFTEAALTAFAQDLLAGQCLHQIAEPAAMTRYCPECGHVGEVSRSHRDCCPDGSHAFKVPTKYAADLRKGFKARLSSAQSGEPAAPQAVQAAVPDGWKLAPIKVPDSAFAWVSGGYPAGYKAGDKRDTAVVHERAQRTWEAILNGITAPAHPAEVVPAQAVKPGDALIEAVDKWFADNTGLGGCSDKDVAELAAIFAATQPAAQGMDAHQYRLIERGELIEAGDQFLRDDFTWQIDPRGIFVGVPHGAALRPARRAIAAQAEQGGDSNDAS